MLKGGIGFFDSGLGGLSVLLACRDVVRGFPVYYYGDNLHAPYGNRSIYEMRAYVRKAFDFFEKMRVRAAVVACNTVTALMIEELRGRYAFPIVGVEPAVLPAVGEGGRVLVLATKATCQSTRLAKLIDRAKAENPNVEIRIEPCLNLAFRIEVDAGRGEIDLRGELPNVEADSVVLGCTHYWFVKDQIADFYHAKVFDGNTAVANRLNVILRSGISEKFWGENQMGGKSQEAGGNDVNAEKDGEGLKTGQNDENSTEAENGMVRLTKIDHFRHFLSLLSSLPFFLRKKEGKLNRFRLRKNAAFQKIENVETLYFIGSGRTFNRNFYERMFGFQS